MTTHAKHPHKASHPTNQSEMDMPTQSQTEPGAPLSSEATASVSTQSNQCPASGGATSTRQMSSTVTMVLTDYQYWHFQNGHHPGSVA
jgi:hypothetical protein